MNAKQTATRLRLPRPSAPTPPTLGQFARTLRAEDPKCLFYLILPLIIDLINSTFLAIPRTYHQNCGYDLKYDIYCISFHRLFGRGICS